MSQKLIIKKSNSDYYLFLCRNEKDIFINVNIARLELKRSTPIYDTLDSQMGTIEFAPSKKELRIIITRYAGENRTYKLENEQKGIAFKSEFAYWEINNVIEQHFTYLLETVYYNLKQDIYKKLKTEKLTKEINDLKWQLLDLYKWELDWENRTKRNNANLYRTNSYHVETLKETIKNLKGEIS